MTKQEIGAILMSLRKKSGKTRDEVAELLGKSVKTIGHWETGHAQPDANTLFLLCTIYDADLNSSFGFADKTTPENEKFPEPDETDSGEIMMALENVLVKAGFIKPGEDISERDMKFLMKLVDILIAWFEER